MLEAAGLSKPPEMKIDGISLLPILRDNSATKHAKKHQHQHHYYHERNASLTSTQLYQRVFLWHKDTERFGNDDRYQSAGVYEDLKVITSTPKGCVDRIFDLKHDPFESRNLMSAELRGNMRHCLVNFDKFDGGTIEKIVDKQAAAHHCATAAAFHGLDGQSEVASCINRFHKAIVDKIKVIIIFKKKKSKRKVL